MKYKLLLLGIFYFFCPDIFASQVSVKYGYDALGRLTKVDNHVNGKINYEYDAAGNRKQVVNTSSNRPPVAQNDFVSATQFSELFIYPLANDSDPDGDSLSIVSFAGSFCKISGNKVHLECFFPNPGSWQFTYNISDGQGATASATISIAVSTGGRPF